MSKIGSKKFSKNKSDSEEEENSSDDDDNGYDEI